MPSRKRTAMDPALARLASANLKRAHAKFLAAEKGALHLEGGVFYPQLHNPKFYGTPQAKAAVKQYNKHGRALQYWGREVNKHASRVRRHNRSANVPNKIRPNRPITHWVKGANGQPFPVQFPHPREGQYNHFGLYYREPNAKMRIPKH